MPSSTGSHSVSSGYSVSSGLSEVIASAMLMRRLFIAQSDDEGDDDAVDSHWEDYSILIVLVCYTSKYNLFIYSV